MKRLLCSLSIFLSCLSLAQSARLKVIIPMSYDDILGFSEGLSWAYNGDKWGVIDVRNNTVIPFIHELPGGDCKNGRILIPSECAFFDVHGNKVFSFVGASAYDYSEGLAVILIDDNDYKVVDISGKVVFEGHGQFPGDGFHDGMLLFRDSYSGLFGFVNVNGEVTIKAQYSEVLPFSEGLSTVVNKDGKYGFINRAGALVIPCSYDMALPFIEEYAWCELDGMGFFIDKFGRIRIKNRSMSQFMGGLAIVRPSRSDPPSYQQYGALVINKEGDALFATENYDQTKRFGKDHFLIISDNSWSITNNNGVNITKEVSSNFAIPLLVNDNDIIIIQDPISNKVGAIRLEYGKNNKDQLPGESYAQWVERLHKMGEGVK